ncbi:MAG: winged helix-turn-helix domain-containing protein [Candidatus Riflebacteria bacterium]|nr:winged helix-turn-helix domain-containing protein [Candidatus Riflebacteria bacterium]
MLQLSIVNNGQEPIYRQISEQIATLIITGRLKSGQRLLPERELALQLGVARGTIKKAYETLIQQKYIVAARGRGSRVADSWRSNVEADVPVAGSNRTRAKSRNAVRISRTSSTNADDQTGQHPISRMEQASKIINTNILQLEQIGFSYREISDLFGLLLSRREEEAAKFYIAAVDCNPEALGIYQSQLVVLTHMSTARILFSELRQVADPSTMLAPFDLILTTSNHIDELRQLAPSVAEKAVPVVVAPSQNTLIALARLNNNCRVGVLYQSARFFHIIGGWVKKSGFNGSLSGSSYLESSCYEIEEFVADKDVLIVPPGFSAQLSPDFLHIVNRFREGGGQVIDFAYQIERGSLMHIEELIKRLLNRAGKQL